jgi:hypothetical protein
MPRVDSEQKDHKEKYGLGQSCLYGKVVSRQKSEFACKVFQAWQGFRSGRWQKGMHAAGSTTRTLKDDRENLSSAINQGDDVQKNIGGENRHIAGAIITRRIDRFLNLKPRVWSAPWFLLCM